MLDKVAILDIRFIAADDTSRARGLMHAEPLADNEVAFFIFPKNDRYSFWNKNVGFDLSLAFVDEFGRVAEFADMPAESTKAIHPIRECKCVIEASKGTFEKLGIRQGDLVNLSTSQLHVIRFGNFSKRKEVSG